MNSDLVQLEDREIAVSQLATVFITESFLSVVLANLRCYVC